MIQVTLKDESVKKIESEETVMNIAKIISEGLARNATASKINGEIKDLRTIIDKDCKLEILTFESDLEGKGHIGIQLHILWLKLLKEYFQM